MKISEILKKLGAEAISQSEAGIHSEPEETGATFEENALIKAKAGADFEEILSHYYPGTELIKRNENI